MPKSEIEISKETRQRIGKKLRAIRKSQGYKNYEAFAAQFNYNKVTINRIENGEDFRISTLIKLLNTFDLSLSEFFEDFD